MLTAGLAIFFHSLIGLSEQVTFFGLPHAIPAGAGVDGVPVAVNCDTSVPFPFLKGYS
jgi:hypothetical protein